MLIHAESVGVTSTITLIGSGKQFLRIVLRELTTPRYSCTKKYTEMF
jgi:hypothetical protein